MPVSAPLSRGILATSFVEVPAGETRRGAGRRCTRRRTRASRSCASCAIGCPRWRRSPGSNYAEVGFTLGASSRRSPTRTLAVVSATDNLIKGGAGQAIQNMNLMLGLPETMSLEDPGPWP